MDKQANAQGPARKRLRRKWPAWPPNYELPANTATQGQSGDMANIAPAWQVGKPSGRPSRSEGFCLAAVWATRPVAPTSALFELTMEASPLDQTTSYNTGEWLCLRVCSMRANAFHHMYHCMFKMGTKCVSSYLPKTTYWRSHCSH